MLNLTTGLAASALWMALCAVTMFGTLRETATQLPVNLVMGGAFGLIAVFLLCRSRAVHRLRRAHPDCPITASVLRYDLLANLAMMLTGGAMAGAAAHRVFSEGVPVFG